MMYSEMAVIWTKPLLGGIFLRFFLQCQNMLDVALNTKVICMLAERTESKAVNSRGESYRFRPLN